MTKKIRILELLDNDASFGITLAFSWALRRYYVSAVVPHSVAHQRDVRVGDVISSVSSLSRMAALKRKLSRMASVGRMATVKKLRLNFKKHSYLSQETFYNFISQQRKIVLSLRRYSASSTSASLLLLDMKAPKGGGPSSIANDKGQDGDNILLHDNVVNPIADLVQNGSPGFLSFDSYNELLTYAEEHPEIIAKDVAVRPRSGTIIFYDYSSQVVSGVQYDEKKARSHFRCDQYRFANCSGEKAVGKAVRRAYYNLYDPNCRQGRHEFKRLEVRKDKSDKRIILFHYVGDCDLAAQVANSNPHGNSKYNQNAFIRTKPFVNMKIAEKSSTLYSPQEIYITMQGAMDLGPQTATDGPRNAEQVRNTVKRTRGAQYRLSRDAIYNLTLLEQLLVMKKEKFIGNFTVPRVTIPLYAKPLLDELDRLLKRSTAPVELFYDTVFTMRNFYLSAVAFRHPFFVGDPVLAVAYLIHERKFKDDHLSFLSTLKKYCPSLERHRTIIVTDQEFDFELLWANTTHVLCWTHMQRAVSRHLTITLHLAPGDYIEDFKDLREKETEVEFDLAWQETKKAAHWLKSAAAVAYFENTVFPNFKQKSAIWVLRSAGILNPSIGVTSNPAESYNAVMHRMTKNKAVPADVCVLALYHLSIYYWREIMRGYHRLGNMHLKQSHFLQLSSDPSDMPSIPTCPPVDQIVDACFAEAAEGKWGEWAEDADAELDIQVPVLEDGSQPGHVKQSRRGPIDSIAMQLLKLGHLSANTDSTFTVKDLNGKPNAIQLSFKKNTAHFYCSCNPTKECVHIKVVKLQLNMELDDDVGNITEFKRRSKPAAQRRTGQKAPRIGDDRDDPRKVINEQSASEANNNVPHAPTVSVSHSNAPRASTPVLDSNAPRASTPVLDSNDQRATTVSVSNSIEPHANNPVLLYPILPYLPVSDSIDHYASSRASGRGGSSGSDGGKGDRRTASDGDSNGEEKNESGYYDALAEQLELLQRVMAEEDEDLIEIDNTAPLEEDGEDPSQAAVIENAVADRRNRLQPILKIATSEECMLHLVAIMKCVTPCIRHTEFSVDGTQTSACNPLSADDELLQILLEKCLNRLEKECKRQKMRKSRKFLFDYSMFVWAPEAVKYALRKVDHLSDEDAEKTIILSSALLPHERHEVQEQIMSVRYSETAFD